MANRRYAASAIDPRAKAQLSGPLFSPDADRTLRQNIRKMLAAVGNEGESVVEQRAPRLTGALVGGIESRTAGRRPWALTAVVSATHVYPWGVHGSRGFVGRAEAQYRGVKAEARYRMFRSAANQLQRARAVLAANLTEGLE